MLDANTSVKFMGVPLPDYHATKSRASTGRTVLLEGFDGLMIRGKVTVKDIRYLLQGYRVFKSM
jgi:hypothetical protein